VAFIAPALGPAKKDVTGGLYQAGTIHHPLAVVGNSLTPAYRSSTEAAFP
jgi:hypothetical protein